MRLLVQHGADPEASDSQFHLPAAGWADHFAQADVAAYLRGLRPAG